MATKFKKAEITQAKLKIGFYGGPGSGKTFTALMVATNLGKTALIDTEHGSDFYASRYPFDVLHTKSLQEAKEAIIEIGASDYDCLIIDSITHLWESPQAAFLEKLARQGKSRDLQFQDWRVIKKPYKEFINDLLNLNKHVFLIGRMGAEYSMDGGQLVKVGDKMKAEAETPYEPHVLIKMEIVKKGNDEHAVGTHLAYFEKDRSSMMEGVTVENPTFETFKPILTLLKSGQQPQMATESQTSEKDQELFDAEEKKLKELQESSYRMKEDYTKRIMEAPDRNILKKIAADIEKAKSKMLEEDTKALRVEYMKKNEILK